MLNWLLLIFGGIAIGLITAAPVGAVNVVCIRRTLTYGPLNGFLAGLGAAAGDGIFAFLAAYGHSAIGSFMMNHERALGLVGGAFLIALGIYTFWSDPAKASLRGARTDGSVDLPHMIAATFAMTITNPATLLAFTAIFASLGRAIGIAPNFTQSAIVVVSVMIGSAAWWLILALSVGMLHGQIGPRWLTRINHLTGTLIALLGVTIIVVASGVF